MLVSRPQFMAFSSPRKTSSRAETCRRYSSLAPESTRCVLITSTVCLYLCPFIYCIYLPSLPPPSHISSVHLHSLLPPRPACLKQPSSLQLTPSSSNKTRNVREAQITQCTRVVLREIYHSLLWAVVVLLA